MIQYFIAYGLINLITGLLVINYATPNLNNNNNNKTIPCDSCKNLCRKDFKRGKIKYSCDKRVNRFSNPPLICGYYKERPVKTVEGNWKTL